MSTGGLSAGLDQQPLVAAPETESHAQEHSLKAARGLSLDQAATSMGQGSSQPGCSRTKLVRPCVGRKQSRGCEDTGGNLQGQLEGQENEYSQYLPVSEGLLCEGPGIGLSLLHGGYGIDVQVSSMQTALVWCSVTGLVLC